MVKKKLVFLISFQFIIVLILYSQKQSVSINFDNGPIQYKEKEFLPVPHSIFEAQSITFVKGLKGRALDLSKNAALRMPLELTATAEPNYDARQSFAVELWIRTIPGAKVNTPIGGNKKSTETTALGWLLSGTTTGSWAFHLSDGNSQYDYEPTSERQPINDGQWHQLGFSYDTQKEELWMYYDGQNVAIYNTPGLGSLKSDLSTVFGGTKAKWDYHGQWEAFNGYIDEIKFWPQPIAHDLFLQSFRTYFPSRVIEKAEMYGPIKVMAWNIWHGGRHFGKEVGVDRIIETIRETNSDIIGLIETYGSGAIIADGLGYHFYLISSNLSILSRFPITETIQAFKPFNFGGAKIRLTEDKELIYFDTWLHYLPDVKKNLYEGKMTAADLVKEEANTRLAEVNQILIEIQPYLETSEQIPLIMGGDFNTDSHLDWTDRTKASHLGYSIPWPVTISMENAQFTDSYREVFPDPLMMPGYSFWPYGRKADKEKYIESRIDYIFYKGSKLKTISSKVLNYHPIMWPSDHAAVITSFRWVE